MSEGGAYVHNLMTGRIVSRPEPRRSTPYHQAHSTALAGLSVTTGGDNRFYNNVLAGNASLSAYDAREYPLLTGGNVYFGAARPYAKESSPLVLSGVEPKPGIVEEGDRVFLVMTLGPEAAKPATQLVNTALLGKAKVPGLAYENPDGSPIVINTDYLGKARSVSKPSAGPFENPGQGSLRLKVW